MSTEGTDGGATAEGQQQTEPEQEVPVVIHPKPASIGQTPPAKKSRFLTENAPAGAIFVVFMASLVLLIQTCTDCSRASCKGNTAWGLALSVISTAISLISWFILAGLEKRPDFTQERPALLLRIVSVLLFALWIPGAGVLTFDGPYVSTGNAYFACWLGFISSALLFCLVERPKMPTVIVDSRTVSLFVIMLAAIILLVQTSLDYCTPNSSCTDEPAWALSVGIIVTVLCFVTLVLLHFRDDLLGTWGIKGLAILLFAIWVPGAGVLTFRGPYTTTSNAYFACWGGFLASGYFFFATLFPQKLADLQATNEKEKQQETS